MQWVETTGRSIDEAKESALTQLGIADDEAEFEILEEPQTGLFGRTRGEARVRARVKPTTPRAKTERRDRRGRGEGGRGEGRGDGNRGEGRGRGNGRSGGRGGDRPQRQPREEREPREKVEVDPAVVGETAKNFLSGLATAFGAKAEVTVSREGEEIDVTVDGNDLGLMVGPGGATLLAIQDLVRVASQRRLGDQDTRLRIDIAGYRERRKEALSRFSMKVAQDVLESGSARALEPMSSADRKVVHDTLAEVEGISTRSQGEEPRRRVVVEPA
jgi:spoIIIJ-associated protein